MSFAFSESPTNLVSTLGAVEDVLLRVLLGLSFLGIH